MQNQAKLFGDINKQATTLERERRERNCFSLALFTLLYIMGLYILAETFDIPRKDSEFLREWISPIFGIRVADYYIGINDRFVGIINAIQANRAIVITCRLMLGGLIGINLWFVGHYIKKRS
jgi:type IV secretory pathway TrbD component